MKNFIALMAIFALIGCGPQNEQKAASTPVVSDVKPVNYMSIGLKPDEFKTAFNSMAEANNSAFRILVLSVKQGATGKQFEYQFDSNITLLGTIEASDGTIRSLTTMAAVVGTKESATKIPLIMHSLIQATNPTLPDQDSAALALGLFTKSVEKMGTPFEEVRNGLRYAALFSKGMGMLFVIDQKR